MAYHISSGVISTGISLSYDSMFISSGGVANSTTVNSGCWMDIYHGGVANSTTVNYDGHMYIENGGVANSTTLNSGGWMHIFSGGVANSTTVNPYGSMYISSGGEANSTTVSGGEVYISSGGVANSTTVNFWGSMYISSGGEASSTTVNSGGSMYIYSGGVANSTTVNSDGDMYIANGGTATEIVENGGYVFVANGANVTFASNTIKGITLSYTSMTVHSNTIANSTTVNTYGYMYISSGGVANSTTVNSGSMYISSGGVANSITVNYDGYIGITSGGTATNIIWTPCVGSVYAQDGAYVTYANSYFGVYFGSNNKLLSHTNSMTGKVVSGSMYVMSGGVANSTTVNFRGSMYISSGGVANSTTVDYGGSMYIYSGGVANNTTVNYDGHMYISSGGEANSTTVNSRGSMFISSGGVANSTTVNWLGYMHISSGGVANSTTVNYDGHMYISSGGEATEIIENGGYVYVEDGANVTFASNTIEGVTLSNTSMTVHSNTIANSTRINSGGRMNIYHGGEANSTRINSGGWMNIYHGGEANSTTVNSRGYMYISSGGEANSTTVNSGGSMYIYSGVHRGSLQIESGAIVVAYSGATIDFTLSDRKESDGYLINDYTRISGRNHATYTITVSAEQAFGTYKLAQGAENFTGSVSVGDGSVNYGTLTVNGSSVEYNNTSYALVLSDGNLSLAVGEAVIKPVLTGDKNGVVFTNITGDACVEFSKDNFVNVLQVTPSTNAVDTYGMPSGTYQWQVCADGTCIQGDNIISDNVVTPQKFISDADGDMDIFFANANGVWERGYAAQHQGSGNWQGTRESIVLSGKNKIADVFNGSSDANVLVLTDDSNGDALFIDDIYTQFGSDASRLAQIDEIRAGAGNDIVDMTSQLFAYVGNGVKIYGGAGDDVIWANSGNNTLFGDAGNDRLVGANGDDIIIGGAGNDSMQGGGGNDTFCFGANFGNDTVEQLSGGSVTLHFETGSEANWNQDTLTYTDGANSVKVSGVTNADVTLVFGGTAPVEGAFLDAASEKIFEDKSKNLIA